MVTAGCLAGSLAAGLVVTAGCLAGSLAAGLVVTAGCFWLAHVLLVGGAPYEPSGLLFWLGAQFGWVAGFV